jgi:arabinogalactan oligomer/maltooligosaccharide transport system substrate-binding protein
MRPVALLLAVVLAGGCAHEDEHEEAHAPHLHFWHMFNRQETDALNELLAQRPGPDVETSLLSFARGQTILGAVLRAGREDCPDLARIDATWLPGLVEDGLVLPVPQAAWAARDWLPEAAELASWKGTPYAVPQALTGLVLLHRRLDLRATWPPMTLDDLEAAARELTAKGRHGLGLRIDGYWFIAFLRAAGGDTLDPAAGTVGVDRPEARRALERFAGLFAAGGLAPPPDAPADQGSAEVRRFRSGEVAILVQGPWAVYDLTGGDTDGVHATAFPRDPVGRPAAPRGGQLYVVPRCAHAPAAAWALAIELTDPALQASWSHRFGVVPVTRGALAASERLSREIYQALQLGARPLTRHPLSAQMFDDLSPAIEAVVVGDATADEALDGVARAWTRMLRR